MKQVAWIVFALMVAWGVTECERGGGTAETPGAVSNEELAAEMLETIEAVEDEAGEEMLEAAADAITD